MSEPPTDAPLLPPDAPPIDSADSARDKLGRWRPGNRASVGNGGNAGRRRELTDALMAAITPEDVQRVARRLVADAEAGDVSSAALVLAYGLGRPAQAEPEATASMSDILHGAHERWLRRTAVAEVEAERPAVELVRTLPELPRGLAHVGMRDVEHEERAPARKPERLEPRALPEPEDERPLLPARRPGSMTVEELLDGDWRPC